MKEKKALIRKPTTTEIEALLEIPNELVYIHFSSSGAMGHAGEVVLGEQSKNGLIIHNFNHMDWDKRDEPFFALMDQLYQFIRSTIRSAGPRRDPLDLHSALENEYFRIAGGMGNHVLLNKRHEFELGDSAIYLKQNGTRTPLLLTSAPLCVVGPQFFPNSHGPGGHPQPPIDSSFDPEDLPY